MDQKRQQKEYERIKDEKLCNNICQHNLDHMNDAEMKRREQVARFQREQMEANEAHVAEKERRKALQKAEDEAFVPAMMFGEENRLDKAKQNEANARFRRELQAQIDDDRRRKKSRNLTDKDLDTLPGLKFGEFEDKYAAMKARYMQSLREQLLEKERKGKKLDEEKVKDMERIKQEINKQIQQEKEEARKRDRSKRAFFEEEARRVKELQKAKKRKAEEEVRRDQELFDKQVEAAKEEEDRKKRATAEREAKYLDELRRQIDQNIQLRKDRNKTQQKPNLGS